MNLNEGSNRSFRTEGKMYGITEDDDLVQRLLETGSEEALHLLMQKYYKPIYAYVFNILKNHQDADEITNETFLKAFEKRKTIKYPKRFVGWLYTTAKNLAIDRKRNYEKETKQMPEFVSFDNSDGAREAAEASILAAQQAQQTETDQYLLTRLLRLLTEKDLEVVQYLSDGLKPREIAEAIGSTAEAVQKRLERIFKWLRPIAHQLDELMSDLPPQEQKVMERYLDNQSPESIGKNLGISPHDVEACVKRVIKLWKKTVTQKLGEEVN